jgi:hypothetical protein
VIKASRLKKKREAGGGRKQTHLWSGRHDVNRGTRLRHVLSASGNFLQEFTTSHSLQKLSVPNAAYGAVLGVARRLESRRGGGEHVPDETATPPPRLPR